MIDYLKHKKGSEWGLWDLHIHSSASDGKGTPEEIITKAKEKGLSVIALTDHHTAKNIDKIKEEGIKENITVISGIEFRTEYGNKSVHMIGLFPDKYKNTILNSKALHDLILSPLNISETKIIAKGREKNNTLNEEQAFNEGMFLVQVPFKDASKKIHEYGGVVIVHAGNKCNSIEKEMKHIGSSNKNVTTLYDSLGTVKEELFKENHIDICEIINENDSAEFYLKTFKKPSITASDAHELEDIGTKSTWIKANPTFEGLKQLLNEPEDRVCIGEKPEILLQTENNPTKYIDSLTIDHVDGYDGSKGKWFKKIQIELNHELVAIIGNKGKGKSAVAEIIGLCGNSRIKESDLSFLNKDKFKKAKLAENFNASILFHSNLELSKNLNDDFKLEDVEYIKYIPQGYFNTLCNEIGKSRSFEEEIEKVVFQHVEVKDRLGKNTFRELIEYKKTTIKQELGILKNELSTINVEIVNLEKKRNSNYKLEIEKSLEKKQQELEAHNKTKPDEKIDPNKDKNIEVIAKKLIDEIDSLKSKIDDLKIIIKQKEEEIIKLTRDKEEITILKDSIKLTADVFEKFKETNKSKLLKYKINIDDIIKLNIDLSSIETLLKNTNDRIIEIQKELDGEEIQNESGQGNKKIGDKEQLRIFENDLKEKQKLLDKPTQEYQKYIKEVEDWKKKFDEIEGKEYVFGSLEYYKNEKKFIEEELRKELNIQRENRINKVEEIYNKKAEIIEIYKRIKEQIDTCLSSNKNYLKEYKVNIDASFELKIDFFEKFFWYLNRKSSGSFCGKENSEKILSKIIEEKNFNKFEDVKTLLNTIIEYLENDKRDSNEINRNIDEQLKEIDGFYNYLFSLEYLNEDYKLKLAEKDLSQLSPGEKGALLLVFYLLLDKDDKPLIIDQPEDNLDNQSVFNILVPFIKQAKKRRQIIIVTHNPNLAVVADAEQIIHVNINKENENEFSYCAGSIENPQINKCIVDVLEGTMPAFDNRKMKYS